jgi:hypothetical protein
MHAGHSTPRHSQRHTMSCQPVPVHPQERVIRGQLGQPRLGGHTQDNKVLQQLVGYQACSPGRAVLSQIIHFETFGTDIPAGCISASLAFETCSQIVWTCLGIRVSLVQSMLCCSAATQGPIALALLHTAPFPSGCVPSDARFSGSVAASYARLARASRDRVGLVTAFFLP